MKDDPKKNPFGESNDSKDTVFRLPPRGTNSAATVVRPQGAAASPPAIPPSSAPPLPNSPRSGRSALGVAASPLLDLLARLAVGIRFQSPSSADLLRERAIELQQRFVAEAREGGVADHEVQAASYLLCAALDDAALSAPGIQDSTWQTRSLAATLHKDARAGEGFFSQLTTMQQEPGRFLPVLDIGYRCLALGMRGQYRHSARGELDVERIREGLYQLLSRQYGPFERALSPSWQGVDAPYRGPGRHVPVWVIGVAALALVGFAWVVASMLINGRSDSLQGDLAGLVPPRPVLNATASPSPAPVSDALDQLRAALRPDVDSGTVRIEADAQSVTIRLLGQNLFESGSADLEGQAAAVVARIGLALRDFLMAEPGRVVVSGHTDHTPIRASVRFPSNYALSAARAQSALKILVEKTGQPELFRAEGRADWDAAPASGSGLAFERRVEIVVLRGRGR